MKTEFGQNEGKGSFGETPKGTRETRVLPRRGFRRDCILANLPVEQRAKVDKWLFDKGLTYAQVAEACERFLGVKVSRSSVGRYHEKMMDARTKRSKVSEPVSQWVSEWECKAMMDDGCMDDGKKETASQEVSACGKRKTWEELYSRFIEGLMDAAWEAMERYEFELKHEGRIDRREARWVVKLMRLIISARRVENFGVVVAGERAALEMQKKGINIQSRIDENGFGKACGDRHPVARKMSAGRLNGSISARRRKQPAGSAFALKLRQDRRGCYPSSPNCNSPLT